MSFMHPRTVRGDEPSGVTQSAARTSGSKIVTACRCGWLDHVEQLSGAPQDHDPILLNDPWRLPTVRPLAAHAGERPALTCPDIKPVWHR